MSEHHESNAVKPPFSLGRLFAERNRGILWDIAIFLINVFLMGLLTKYFLQLVNQASAGDKLAGFCMFLVCLAVFVLPPLGAILKRWHFHRRMKIMGKEVAPGDTYLTSCLFNPIFYFSLNLVIVAALITFITQFIFGKKDPGQWVSVAFVLSGMLFTLIQTILIYRYFTAPKRDSKSAFLRSPLAEVSADVCIFLNMIFFQLILNMVGHELMPSEPVSGVEDLLVRLFLICFIALLLYFPPRIFYLAEDIKRPAAWITILLANSPVIVRVLFGSAAN